MDKMEVLQRYPRLVGHLISESLGYFTPESAANAIVFYKRGEPFHCEWYWSMARDWNDDTILRVGREVLSHAFTRRKWHSGFMSEYKLAKTMTDHVAHGGRGPLLMSW